MFSFSINAGDNYDPDTKKWDPSGGHMIAQQDFWFVIGMTIFILIPWLTVREVKGENKICFELPLYAYRTL